MIYVFDEKGKVLGYYICTEKPVYGVHEGLWTFVEADKE